MKPNASFNTAVPWWKEATTRQWIAFLAARLAGRLTRSTSPYFLLIMKRIADEFHVPPTTVAVAFTIIQPVRHFGAVIFSWLANPVGHHAPLMMSVLWYPIRHVIAGFWRRAWLLLLIRALLGVGMGAERPAGTALPMDSGPPAHAVS